MDSSLEFSNVAIDDFISTNQFQDYYPSSEELYYVQSYSFPQSTYVPSYSQLSSVSPWSPLACQVGELETQPFERHIWEVRPYSINITNNFSTEPRSYDLTDLLSPCSIPTTYSCPTSRTSDLTTDSYSLSSSSVNYAQQHQESSPIQISRMATASAPSQPSFPCSECTKSFLRPSDLK